uniref:Uncharacterized protein n=1 Tax=Oryza brachyantha TaxID=4533 RepID=J3M3I0_ORYBR
MGGRGKSILLYSFIEDLTHTDDIGCLLEETKKRYYSKISQYLAEWSIYDLSLSVYLCLFCFHFCHVYSLSGTVGFCLILWIVYNLKIS